MAALPKRRLSCVILMQTQLLYSIADLAALLLCCISFSPDILSDSIFVFCLDSVYFIYVSIFVFCLDSVYVQISPERGATHKQTSEEEFT